MLHRSGRRRSRTIRRPDESGRRRRRMAVDARPRLRKSARGQRRVQSAREERAGGRAGMTRHARHRRRPADPARRDARSHEPSLRDPPDLGFLRRESDGRAPSGRLRDLAPAAVKLRCMFSVYSRIVAWPRR